MGLELTTLGSSVGKLCSPTIAPHELCDIAVGQTLDHPAPSCTSLGRAGYGLVLGRRGHGRQAGAERSGALLRPCTSLLPWLGGAGVGTVPSLNSVVHYIHFPVQIFLKQ